LLPLSHEDSRTLFLAITKIDARDTDFDALDEILDALDGIPLAIVLMARRAETAGSLRDLANGWKTQRTKMLKEGETGDRELNLEVSVEMSIGDPRMDDDARNLLYLLGLLPIGIETEDLENLLPGSYEAKDKLIATGIAIRTDYGIRLLGPIREYIKDNHNPSEEAQRRLVNYFFDLVHRAPRLGWDDGRDIFRRLSRNETTIPTLI
jgi:hypothetical protein